MNHIALHGVFGVRDDLAMSLRIRDYSSVPKMLVVCFVMFGIMCIARLYDTQLLREVLI